MNNSIYIGELTISKWDGNRIVQNNSVRVYQHVIQEISPILTPDLFQASTEELLFIARILNIPSHSPWYYSKDNQSKIPFPAYDPQTIREDIYYWLTFNKPHVQNKPLFNIRRKTISKLEFQSYIYKIGIYGISNSQRNNEQTRFIVEWGYGQPPTRYTNIKDLYKETLIVSLNLPSSYSQRISTILQLQTLEALALKNNDLLIEQTFQTTDAQRVYTDISAYVDLIGKMSSTTLSVDYILGKPYLSSFSYHEVERLWDDLPRMLKQYTDIQIESALGQIVKTEYGNRRVDYIKQVIDIITRPQWRLLTNNHAYLCQPHISVISQTLFTEIPQFLAYGSLLNGYTAYDFDDLQTVLTNYQHLHVFPDPYDTNAHFTVDDIKHILNILPQSPLEEAFHALLDNIRQEVYIHIIHWMNKHPETRSTIEDYFLKLFEMGMYLRRWQGPGNPYPLLDTLTENETFNCPIAFQTSTNATITGGQLGDLLNTIPEIKDNILDLPIYTKYDGEFKSSISTIGEFISSLAPTGTELGFCIRVSSHQIAYTGAYYMKKLFGNQPPNFDLYQDNIAWH